MNSKRAWEFELYKKKLPFFDEMDDGGTWVVDKNGRWKYELKTENNLPIQDDHFARVTFERCSN